MGKSFELDSAKLVAGAAVIAGTVAMMPAPAEAGAGGGGNTVFISDESCTVCTGDFLTNTPLSAFVFSNDPANPADPLNTANWADIYFQFAGGIWETLSTDETGDPLLLPTLAIGDVLAMLSASVTYLAEDATTVDFAEVIGTQQFETEVITDSDGQGPTGVPEPGSGVLLGAGAAALALLGHRRKIAITSALQNQGSISIGGQTISKS